MYILPWHDIIVSGNFSVAAGTAVTRQISRALTFGANQTINLEPLGTRGSIRSPDRRPRSASCSGSRTTAALEASVDFDNLINANTRVAGAQR